MHMRTLMHRCVRMHTNIHTQAHKDKQAFTHARAQGQAHAHTHTHTYRHTHTHGQERTGGSVNVGNMLAPETLAPRSEIIFKT